MDRRAIAALFVLAIWWLSTAVVLRLVWLGRSRARFAVMTVLAGAAFVGIFWSSRVATTATAYVAFSSALVVWAWHELAFLLGMITGPRSSSCPKDARGWRRFRLATEVVIFHEVALALTMLATVALTWRQPNQVATSTFGVLWVMRLSAKLNVFFGVRNLTEKFVPQHLKYMISYFRRARMTAFMPISVLASSAAAAYLARELFSDQSSAFAQVGGALVTTLLVLAIVEHLFLSMPVPDAVLWEWAVRNIAGRPARTLETPAP